MNKLSIVILLRTGDDLHTEYMEGDREFIKKKVKNLMRWHEIVSVSVNEGNRYKDINVRSIQDGLGYTR